MLKYIYTGQVESKQPEELLKAAHKYILDDLVNWLEIELSNNITTSNVTQLLILAKMFNTETLRKSAIAYIAVRWSKVRGSENWRALTVSNPEIVEEVYPEVLDIACLRN